MSDIYQHFRPEERDFIDKTVKWKQQVADMYAPKLTGFLDPRQRQILRSVVGSGEEVLVSFFGGYPNAERKRALIHPSYFEPKETDFDVSLFDIEYPHKFASISHPHILGSMMGLGLKREKFGDILNEQERFQVIVAKELVDYLHSHFDHVGKVPVSLKEKPFSEALYTAEDWREQAVTVSSLRLDVIISALPSMSRQKAQQLIKGGAVKVNWRAVDQPSFECATGDMLSIRGTGRVKILSLDGQTKKEKWRMTLGILK
ncbi:RNA-binding protein [Domibacillus indicus]|uniref:YlmH family RNA-binding protein n=1 Tax=Domibacillus indicus TaxID=1437523 RepID=UPI0020415D04|nr:RNA-binding protein [Domibacillus indicus]MCM3787641.1 RNA-binding protein [Domibacillus indicus]